MGPVWKKWGDWLGAATLLVVLAAMGFSPYMGAGVVPWVVIYGPVLLILYWLLRPFVKFRPGTFMLSLAVLLAVRLTLNGISYEAASRLDQPVLFRPLEKPASFRYVYFYDGAPDGGEVSSICGGICLALLTLRDVSFMEISPEAPDRVANKNKQRVRYDWQNPACVAWVGEHVDLSDRLHRLNRGSGLQQMWFNYSKDERAILQSEWDEVKNCFVYEEIEKFEAYYSYSVTKRPIISQPGDKDDVSINFEDGDSRVFLNDFKRTAWILFRSGQDIHKGLVGVVGVSTMYSYRAFAIPTVDPLVGASNFAFVGEPTSEVSSQHGLYNIDEAALLLIKKAMTGENIK